MAAWRRVAYPEDRRAAYRLLEEQLAALMEGERDALANMANASALVFQALPDLNWAGFYLYKQGMLVLGPFQGMPACVRIPLSRGVCGAAARERRTLVVEDVHAFPGHIACDSASASEIVIPLLAGEKLLGVMDLDSPVRGRFDETDRQGLEGLASRLAQGCDWGGKRLQPRAQSCTIARCPPGRGQLSPRRGKRPCESANPPFLKGSGRFIPTRGPS